MGHIASAFKAGNLIRAKKFDILCTHAQEQLGKTKINPYSVFVCLFFFFLFRNSCQ